MTESRPPTWRATVDRLDRAVSPKADAIVRTNLFADAVAAIIRLEAQVRRRAERETSRLWHLWNLPTADDVRRVRSQLSAVEARLRDVSERLEESEEARHANGSGHAEATAGAARSRAPRARSKPQPGNPPSGTDSA
jgi:hypothetical protein